MMASIEDRDSGGKLNKAISKVRSKLSRSSRSPPSPPKDVKKLLVKASPRSDSRFFPETTNRTEFSNKILAVPAQPAAVATPSSVRSESQLTDSLHAELSALKAQHDSLGDAASTLNAELQQARVEAEMLKFDLESADTTTPTHTPAQTPTFLTPGVTKASPMATPSSLSSKQGVSSTKKPPLWNEVQRLKELVEQKEVALNTLEAARAADALTATAVTERASQRVSELQEAANKTAAELSRATSQLWGARDAAKKAQQDSSKNADAAKIARAKAKAMEATVTSLQAQLSASEAALEAAEELAAQAHAQSQGAIAALEERLEEAETARVQLQATVEALVKENATLAHTVHAADESVGTARSSLSENAADATLGAVGDVDTASSAAGGGMDGPIRSGIAAANPLKEGTGDPDPSSQSVYPKFSTLSATPLRRTSTNDSAGGSVRSRTHRGDKHKKMVYMVSKKANGSEKNVSKAHNVSRIIGAGMAALGLAVLLGVIQGRSSGSSTTRDAQTVQKGNVSLA